MRLRTARQRCRYSIKWPKARSLWSLVGSDVITCDSPPLSPKQIQVGFIAGLAV